MAQGKGLNVRQEQFLAVVLREETILKNFYLSGGTALSGWYLHHRESYDLDFFSDRPFDGEKIAQWIKQNEEELAYQSLSVNDDFGFYSFFIRYPNNDRLKIDFAHYAPERLVKGFFWKSLEIDSLYDIAVNKVHTIRTNPRERDYVDLYCLLKKTHWNVEKLLIDADKKFRCFSDVLHTAKNFLRASEITDYPKMLIPFNKKNMHIFFEKLALALKPKILKER